MNRLADSSFFHSISHKIDYIPLRFSDLQFIQLVVSSLFTFDIVSNKTIGKSGNIKVKNILAFICYFRKNFLVYLVKIWYT